MNLHGIEFDYKFKAPLEPEFIPMKVWNDAYLSGAKENFSVAIERNDGLVEVENTFIYGDAEHFDADVMYINRLVKQLIWARGGYKIYLAGNEKIANKITKMAKEHLTLTICKEYMAKNLKLLLKTLMICQKLILYQ